MKKRNLSLLLAASLFSSFSVLAAGCSNDQPANSQVQSMPSVKVITLGAEAGSSMVSGKVIADQEVQVVSKIPGKVAHVEVQEGAVVKKGQLLVQLDSSDYLLQVKQAEAGIAYAQAKLADVKAGAREQELRSLEGAVQQASAAMEQAKAAIDQAKAAYDLAQQTYDRTKSLFDSGAVSQAELDRVTFELEGAKTAYQQAQAQYEAAQGAHVAAQSRMDLAKAGATGNTIKSLQAEVNRQKSALELAKNTLEHTSINAPIDGIIIQRNIEPGEMAQPGVPLMTIVKMNHVQIQVNVPQDRINQLKKGAQVAVEVVGLENQLFQGTIDFISPVSDPNNSTFPVKIKVKNEKGLLRAGMLTNVYLSGKADQGLEVPKSAVIQKDNKSYVYKVNHGTVQRIEVQTKEKNQDWFFVTGDVKMNDQVVLHPTDQLKDGMQVRVD